MEQLINTLLAGLWSVTLPVNVIIKYASLDNEIVSVAISTGVVPMPLIDAAVLLVTLAIALGDNLMAVTALFWIALVSTAPLASSESVTESGANDVESIPLSTISTSSMVLSAICSVVIAPGIIAFGLMKPPGRMALAMSAAVIWD